jgi:hypothetical protein
MWSWKPRDCCIAAKRGDFKENPVTDDKSKRDYRDRDRINRNEEYEVRYWCEALGVSEQELLAVDAVGPMVNDVKARLGK